MEEKKGRRLTGRRLEKKPRGVRTIGIALLTVLVLGVGIAYAYYKTSDSQAMTVNTAVVDSSDIVTEVGSFSDLYTYSKDSAYNGSSEVSRVRKVLKFTADITLPADLVITADVHLDLNGHTLNLNDHVLTIKHGYAGVFSIYNGTIEKGVNGEGYIAVDLVHAAIETSDLIFTSNGVVETDSSTYIRIVNMDAKYTSYSALYMAADSFLSDLGERVEFEDFSTVSADSFSVSDTANYIPTKSCSYAGASESCSFVYRDIDLPFYYLSSDIRIEYTSSDTSYLTNGGKLLKLPSAEQDITLTATVSCDSWGSTTYSATFTLHVINLSDSATKTKVGDQLIKSYLQPYYHGESLRVNESTVLVGYYYEFDHTIQLPMTALDGSITYSYKTYDVTGNTETVTLSTVDTDGKVFNFEPDNSCYYLGISINGGSYEKLQMYSVYVGTLESAARMIINAVYGGTIIYDKTQEYVGLTSLEEMQDNETANEYITNYKVTGVTYQIKSGSDAASYYTLTNTNNAYSLALNEDSKADVKQKCGYVTATFTFEDGSTVPIDLYINCYDQSGNTMSNFLAYYSEFDPQVASELTTTIDLPFCYENTAPYVCYDFAYQTDKESATENDETFKYYPSLSFGMPDCLSMGLYYDGAIQYTFTNYTSQTSMTGQLDSFLSSAGMTLTELAKKSDVKYVLKLDPQKATVNDSNMVLIYNYKFKQGDSWTKYQYSVTDGAGTRTYMSELVTTDFVVKGGLFYNTTSTADNAIHDSNFFVWIYNHFNPDGTTISSASATLLIPTDWLGQDVEMDVTTDSILSQVSDFTGINNLLHISKVNLSGKTLTDTVLQGIAEMTSVTDLNLSNCGLTSVDTVSTMTTVKTLDISDNSIQYFDNLVNMTALETVYLYDNNATNKYYGSKGICNSQAYVDLMRNGVAVYNNVSNNIPISYSESDSANDYKRLAAIIYQDKLSSNVKISNLYTYFKTLSATNFDLDNTGGTFTWGYEDGKTEYTATYFYVKYVFSGYTLTVKYYVERY